MIDAQHLLEDGRESVGDLLSGWRETGRKMGVWALVPEAEVERIPEIQAACREQNVPLVGSVFPALVSDRGFLNKGIWLLRFNDMPRRFLLPLDPNDGCDGENLAEALASLGLDSGQGADAIPTLFIVFDAMLPNIGTHLSVVYDRLGTAVKYAGVNARSETFQPMPCLFDQERLFGRGMLGLLLPPEASVVAKHGYPVSRSQMTATSTVGNRIETIDGRPAFEVYRELVRDEYGIDLTEKNFYDYAVHYPLGLITTLDVVVRIPVALNDDGSLFCVGEVPPDSRLWLLRAPTVQESGCVECLANGLEVTNGGSKPEFLLAFYCAGRRMHFGLDDAQEELRQLQARTGTSNLAGALSLGEIDSLEDLDFPRFHNACVLCARR